MRISHCLFSSNSAGGSEVPSGGAIHMAWSNIKVNDNAFVNNRAVAGGAIQMHESDPVFIHNIFDGNSAVDGGGISIGSLSNPTFSGDSIVNNQASLNGGGVMCWDKSVVTFSDVIVQGNKSPWGAGVGLGSVEASFNDCIIQYNTADNLGGGIASDLSNVSITNCLITSNSASMSGGIHAWNDTLEINDSEISLNTADYGGGIHADYSQLKFVNSTFSENQAMNGGGLHIWNCDLDLSLSEFIKNNVTNEGGAIEVNISDTLVFERPYIINIAESQFIENNADFRSGVMKIEQNVSDTSFADIIIDKSLFLDNHAERIAGLRLAGGFDNFLLSNSKFIGNVTDLWNGGASFSLGCTGRVENCEFTDNHATMGNPAASGVSNGSYVHYFNCTFSHNTATNVGGLSVHRDGKASITNCIFWNNSQRQVSVRGIQENAFSELYVDYCDIQYGVDSVEVDMLALLHWGESNIDSDPLFYDPDNLDFHLMNESPCIDAGTDAIELDEVQYYAPMEDLEGNQRPQEGSLLLDMGAYENQDVLALADEPPGNNFLLKTYPNPSMGTVKIEYTLMQAGWINIRIYNFLGEEMANLINKQLESGMYQLTWNAHGMKSGIYICRINVMDKTVSKKIILQR